MPPPSPAPGTPRDWPHKEGFSSPPCRRRETRAHPGVILRRAAGGRDGQQESRCAAKNWLPLLGERAGVRGRLIREGQPPGKKARRRIPSPKAPGGACPSPQPSPPGEGSGTVHRPRLCCGGAYGPSAPLFEKPLPVSRDWLVRSQAKLSSDRLCVGFPGFDGFPGLENGRFCENDVNG